MTSSYRLQIQCSDSREIAVILGSSPHGQEDRCVFVLKREIGENDPWVDVISEFLDLLIGKYELLEKLGVTRRDISIWLLYEYDEQCNMEFAPETTLRLGQEGITLCISCWQGAAPSP